MGTIMEVADLEHSELRADGHVAPFRLSARSSGLLAS
jgi:hypothetical protein